MKYIDPKADLPAQLPLISRKSTILTLLVVLFVALIFVSGESGNVAAIDVQKLIQIEDVPITKQKLEEQEKPN
jgi:hypothetical protein